MKNKIRLVELEEALYCIE